MCGEELRQLDWNFVHGFFGSHFELELKISEFKSPH